MTSPNVYTVLANGADPPSDCLDPIILDYRSNENYTKKIKLYLPQFVRNLYHLPDRTLDLLELAAYVYGADRCISRGRADAVEYHSWSRKINIFTKVRDYDFWSDPKVNKVLTNVLRFMMGDNDLNLYFQPGHSTPPTNLFDDSRYKPYVFESGLNVCLFSGGIDSLAGALDLLENGKEKLILACHQSNNANKKTQRVLYKALEKKYQGRVYPYSFYCSLQGQRAIDETQRSRSFLFTAIAYALSSSYSQTSFYVFENGVTSINLHRREDLLNARASRTTHPQTVSKLKEFYSLLSETDFTIHQPFFNKTKGDVIEFVSSKAPELLSSSVSCTKASYAKENSTHCGKCFQCIDRRIASFSKKLEKYDHRGLYTFDILSESLECRFR